MIIVIFLNRLLKVQKVENVTFGSLSYWYSIHSNRSENRYKAGTDDFELKPIPKKIRKPHSDQKIVFLTGKERSG